MSEEWTILMITAASIGFLHTLLGPDHYIPFIMMAKVRKWSLSRTCLITVLCGVGHVGSSVLLGIIGIALGIAVTKLEIVETFRGNLAAWALIAFGFVYFVWGLRRARRLKPHEHPHIHPDGASHVHVHNHMSDHLHIHDAEDSSNITPWILFVIFVLGPCEPLIPILMYPAAKESVTGLIAVTAVFGSVTILTMLGIVVASSWGLHLISMKPLERYSHALAGGAVFLCGLSIEYLGL